MRSNRICPPIHGLTALFFLSLRPCARVDADLIAEHSVLFRRGGVLSPSALVTKALTKALTKARRGAALVISALAVLWLQSATAHHNGSIQPASPEQQIEYSDAHPALATADQNEFTFARLVYQGAGWSSEWPRWQADWPEAEWHFSRALDRLTRIDTDDEGVLINLIDETVFDYPWLYAVEVGALELSDRELQILREYLLRGGFLMVDDFHGIEQWRQFEHVMRLLFPNRSIEEPASGPGIYSVLFDTGETQQIPGIRPLMANRTWEYGGTVPRWRYIRDDAGRVMVVINFNMDLGDAWEHADDVRYPQAYSSLAYRIGTNYVLYAMTH